MCLYRERLHLETDAGGDLRRDVPLVGLQFEIGDLLRNDRPAGGASQTLHDPSRDKVRFSHRIISGFRCPPATNPLKIRTSTKLTHKPFGISNSKTQDLRPFGIGTSEKRRKGLIVNQKSDKGFLSRSAHTARATRIAVLAIKVTRRMERRSVVERAVRL